MILFRTMRMLSFFDESDQDQQEQSNEVDVQAELQRKIFLEIQRRLPGLLNRKIQKYVSTFNQIPVDEKTHQTTYDYETISRPAPTTTTEPPTTTMTTSTTTSTTTTLPPSTPRVIYTFRSDLISSVPQIQRPQLTPNSDRQRSLRPQPTPYNQIQNVRAQPKPYNQIQNIGPQPKPYVQIQNVRAQPKPYNQIQNIRPQPKPYNELHRSLSPSYTYQHQYLQQVAE